MEAVAQITETPSTPRLLDVEIPKTLSGKY
jgi:hypothetical protein